MKHKIKIRFIKDGDYYMLQTRFLFFWQTFGYNVGGGAGDYVWNPHKSKSKDELIDVLAQDKLGTVRRFVSIIEYPTIFWY